MNIDERLQGCDTLMLDMDGTLLDLAYDNYMWTERIPAEYAKKNGISEDHARRELYAILKQLEGKLDWYCLDHWADKLDLDVVGLHREENARIGWLPGARTFIEAARETNVRLLLVSNSHQHTLDIKTERTAIADYFDGVYLSHNLGHAKEDQPFWHELMARESFDPASTVFIDDNVAVLQSASDFGIGKLLQISQPDTRFPPREAVKFDAITGVSELHGARA